MDNVYILMLIIKRGINVGNFIQWYNWHFSNYGTTFTYDDYVKELSGFLDKILDANNNYHDLGTDFLTEFEFKYFVSFLSLRGDLHE